VREHPRPLYVIYHNPLLQHVLLEAGLRKVRGSLQYAVFEFPLPSAANGQLHLPL
jgi:hypothetical protein